MKYRFLIKGLAGKKTLSGSIGVMGAKNAVLPVMASAILFDGKISLTNVPKIEDVLRMTELLENSGIHVSSPRPRELSIHANDVKNTKLDQHISKRFRASVVMTGPLLARFGEVSFPHPGGCVIGSRPIDIFVDGFHKMGATMTEENETYHFKAKGGKLRGAEIFFKLQSHTATETFIMAGALATGVTVLKNCALEPEIKSLADFLIESGVSITGAGTSTITIVGTGGKLLKAKKPYVTMPDRIEAGSFLILSALCAKDVTITDCNPKDLELLIELLRSSGVSIETTSDSITVTSSDAKSNAHLSALNIKTHEYPGFPTDLQAPMSVYLTQASGESLVFETIFEGRLGYAEDLVRMGAHIQMWDTNRMTIKGPTALKGKELDGPDIRAGLAFIIAGIVAKGDSIINNVYYIDRGYEYIEKRLRALGVSIKRVKVAE